MNLLVTAGNTQTPIDRVRVITNVFSGRTGARVAAAAANRRHSVTLLTSHPEITSEVPGLIVHSYRTFDELESLMATAITSKRYDAVVHAAAVGDYHVAGVFSRHGSEMVDVSAGKVKSHHAELWLKLVPAPKLIDKIRSDWGFHGVLVKFKLEVGVTEAELLFIAERSRVQSRADLMCANTLDGMADCAYLGSAGDYRRVLRSELPAQLIEAVEQALRPQ